MSVDLSDVETILERSANFQLDRFHIRNIADCESYSNCRRASLSAIAGSASNMSP